MISGCRAATRARPRVRAPPVEGDRPVLARRGAGETWSAMPISGRPSSTARSDTLLDAAACRPTTSCGRGSRRARRRTRGRRSPTAGVAHSASARDADGGAAERHPDAEHGHTPTRSQETGVDELPAGGGRHLRLQVEVALPVEKVVPDTAADVRLPSPPIRRVHGLQHRRVVDDDHGLLGVHDRLPCLSRSMRCAGPSSRYCSTVSLSYSAFDQATRSSPRSGRW